MQLLHVELPWKLTKRFVQNPGLYYPENSTPDTASNGTDGAGGNKFGPLNNVITDWNLVLNPAWQNLFQMKLTRNSL